MRASDAQPFPLWLVVAIVLAGVILGALLGYWIGQQVLG